MEELDAASLRAQEQPLELGAGNPVRFLKLARIEQNASASS